MNTILFAQPWVQQLGWTLVHFLWQGAVIAAIFALARPLVRSVNARYVLACGALALMTALPIVTFLVSDFDSNNQGAAVDIFLNQAVPASIEKYVPPPDVWQRTAPWLVIIWLAGVVVFSIRLLGGWLIATRLRFTTARLPESEWQQLVENLARRIGVSRPVKLIVSAAVDVPAVVGWLRPAILTPVGVLSGLPAGYIEALLAHELAHIRRHDFLVNVLQNVAEALLFYHPAIWWVSEQIRNERELCCDDIAVSLSGDAITYVRALAELESARPAHAVAVAASGGQLAKRIRRLLNRSDISSHPLSGLGPACIAILLFLGIGVFAIVNAQDRAAQPVTAPALARDEIWVDTVKQGDLLLTVRASGVFKTPTLIEFTLPEEQRQYVKLGPIVFAAGPLSHSGAVARLSSQAPNGILRAEIKLAEAPDKAVIGAHVDAVLKVGTLNNVLYVGRPVLSRAGSSGNLFKLDPDGSQATRVSVQYGQASMNAIQIQSGLAPGDRVILSDTSKVSKYDRIVIQ